MNSLLGTVAVLPSPPDPAAETWARGFWVCCGLFLLLRTWQGWREGLARQLVTGVALVAAYAVGVWGGPVLGPSLRPVLAAPDLVLSVTAGVLAGAVAYFLVNAFGRRVFPRTRDRAPGPGRLLWGGLGALVGLALAGVSLWVLLIGVRLVGAVAEGHVQAVEPTRGGARRLPPAAPESAPTPVNATFEEGLRGLARVKHALDRGVPGEIMAAVDPVPPAAYLTLNKLARVSSDPAAMERFRNHAVVREIGADPKLTALVEDPTISRELAARNYRALLTHPRILAAANDRRLAAKLRGFDLGKALNEALGEK